MSPASGPREGGIRLPVESDLFPLTAELILRSKLGEVMDDLAFAWQPAAALRRPEEGPVAFPPFTIIIIILGLKQNCNYVRLMCSLLVS